MSTKIIKIAWMNLVLAPLLALLLTLASGCSKSGDREEGGQNSITIKGSDTMVHLVSSWAEAFMSRNPGVEVSVTGGGSGTGIAALLNGTTDICAASRKIKNKELELALQKNIHPRGIAVARDGIAVVVHPENPVSELTLDQLGRIFIDPTARWSHFGGPDEKILVLSRESSSGTYVFFQEMVLKKEGLPAGCEIASRHLGGHSVGIDGQDGHRVRRIGLRPRGQRQGQDRSC